MKQRFAFVLALLFCTHVFAAVSPGDKSGLLVDVDFKFKDAKKSFQIKDKMILAKDRGAWLPIAPATNGVALLAKIDQPNEIGMFSVQYMIVDTTTTPVSVRQMGIISELGRRSEIESRDQASGEGVSIQLVAEETTYREKK